MINDKKLLKQVKTNDKQNLTSSVKIEEVCIMNTNNNQLDQCGSTEKYVYIYIYILIINIVDKRGMGIYK